MSGLSATYRSNRAQNGIIYNGREKMALQSVLVSEVGWVLLIALLLFQQPLLNITDIGIFSYIDEIAVVAVFAAAIAKVLRNKGVTYLTRREHVVCWLGVALLLWVLGCNYIVGVQTEITPLLIDALACSKFAIVVIASFIVFDANRLASLLEPLIKVVIAVMVPCWLLNTFLPGGISLFGQDMGTDVRYGIRSFEFLFGHPETMSMMVLSMMLLLLRDRSRNSKWIAICLFLILTSLRSKGVAFVVIAAVFIFSSRKKGRIGVIPVLLCLAAAVLIGWDQVEFYYGSTTGARAELTRASLEVAADYFPFGTGFATFGSNVTSEPGYYSALYGMYGLSNVSGLSLSGGTNYLSDTFWPTALAQFGWIGLIGYAVLLIMLFRSMYERAIEKKRGLLCVLCFMYLLILSTSGSAFFHPNTICVVLFAAVSIFSEMSAEMRGAEKRTPPRRLGKRVMIADKVN